MANRFLSNIKINDAYTFPASDGSNGQVIVTDGAGNLAFASPSSSSSASVIYRDNFTGDGSTTVFYLQNNLSDEDQTNIYIDGVYQEKGTYSLSNNAITFTTPPPNGDSVEVMSIAGINVGPTTIYQDNFTGDGTTTDFTLDQSVSDEVKTMVYFNGVYQFKGTYSLNGTLMSFDTAPANGVAIEVISIDSAAASDYNQKMLFYGKATEAISKGDAVMFAGAQGDHFLFSKATQAGISANHELFIGLASQDLSNNEYGYVTEFGNIKEIDTSDYTAGDILWFDAGGSTAGALTTTEPAPPLAKIQVAAVIRSHQNEGVLFVRPTWYHELGELHDVNVTSVADKDLLVWDNANGYWENSKTVDTLTGNTFTATTLAGTLSTAAQPNVTSVGTLSGLTVSNILTSTSSSSGDYVRLYAGSGTAQWDIYGNGENLRFSENSGGGGIIQFDSNVGIGKNSQSGNATLTVKSPAGGNTGVMLIEGDTTNDGHGLYATTDNKFVITRFTNGSYSDNFVMDSSGNVGIGTTSPNYKLDVSGDARATGNLISDYRLMLPNMTIGYWDSTYNRIESGSLRPLFITAYSQPIYIGRNGSPGDFTINTNGNLGIGTTSPGGTYGKLSVAGGIRILDDNNAKLEIGRYSSGASNSYIKMGSNSNSLKFTNNADTADVFAIYNNGDVAMGTGTSQTSPLLTSPGRGNLTINGSSDSILTLGINGTWQSYYFVNGNGTYIASKADTPIHLEAGGTTKMFIASGGNVGIGETSPTEKLTIRGTGQKFYTYQNVADQYTYIGTEYSNGNGNNKAEIRFAIDGADTKTRIQFHTAGGFGNIDERMRITSGGYLKASNTGSYLNASANYHELRTDRSDDWALQATNSSASPYIFKLGFTGSSPNGADNWFIYCEDTTTVRFRVASNGNVQNTNNSYGAISDAKLKENIVDASPKLDDLMQVKVRNYNLIGDDKKQLGVVAQELEEVFPSMIDESPDFEEQEVTDEEGNLTTEKVDLGTTTKSVKYSVFVPMLIKAMQEQQQIIEDLKQSLYLH